MSGVVRLLLIWFIAAAVPLKGLAAVTMGGCGPGHHSPSQSGEVVQHTTHVDSADAREDLRFDDSGSATEAVNEVLQTASDPSTGHSAQLKMKCSSCAPCCSVAAPALERVSISHADSTSTAVAFLEIRFPAVFADVPHRPPRLILA
ncbi:MAG: hypothetical protein J0H28_03605 [Methylibium petroleiphilum]|nr:hypothetical protein [Methylibium petroleiphilum]